MSEASANDFMFLIFKDSIINSDIVALISLISSLELRDIVAEVAGLLDPGLNVFL